MTKRYSKSLIFEELEPRLLFSADIGEAFAAAAVQQDIDQVPVIENELDSSSETEGSGVDQPNEEAAPADLAPTEETAAPAAADEQEATETTTKTDTGDTNVTEDSTNNIVVDNATSPTAETTSTRELVIINPSVYEYDQLIPGLEDPETTDRNFEVVILDTEKDGIQQINSALGDYSDLDAVHFITHGTDGMIKLGNLWLSDSNLQENSDAIAAWGDSLGESGDILFYGCNIAEGSDGEDLLNTIAELTQTDVAASTDATGHEERGGDWELEFATGTIETEVAIEPALQESWNGLLDVITVTTFDDLDDGGDTSSIDNLKSDPGSDGISLREAIIATNNDLGADEILLPAGQYTLSLLGTDEDYGANRDLDIRDDLTITGTGALSTIIDGDRIDRVFDLISGTVSISGITVQGGGNVNEGGGLYVADIAELNLSEVVITDNQADHGAGLMNDGTVTATDVTISGNTGTGSNPSGGGIENTGDLTLERVTIDGNSAEDGGGLYVANSSGPVSLTNVTISGNTATEEGGGLWTRAPITIVNSTIASNNAADGGGIFNDDSGPDVTIKNTLIGDNSATSNPDVFGPFTSDGTNLVENPDGGTGLDSDITGFDPSLGTLQYNGGSTRTHALLAGSPAIDAGDNSVNLSEDQHGYDRPVDGDGDLTATIDIGAYEFVPDQLVHVADSGNPQETSAESRGSKQAVAMADNGDYVVVWSSLNQDGSGWGVFAQRYDASGTAVGSEFQINDDWTDNEYWASVAMDDAGNFVVAWTADNQDGTSKSVYARGFNADASEAFAEFKVNTYDSVATDTQKNPSIAMASDGRFVIAWEGAGAEDGAGIYYRRFNADGSARDAIDQPANNFNFGTETSPAVAINDSGDFAITWEQGSNIFMRSFDDDGGATGDEVRVNNLTTVSSVPDVAIDSTGCIAVVWRSDNLVHDGIWMQLYDSEGTAGTSIQVDQNSNEDSTNPSIAMDSTGNIIVVFEGTGDGDGLGVFGRKFNSAGTALTDQFQINQTTSGTQHMASAAMLDEDNFVAVWSGSGLTDDSGVYLRQYSASTETTYNADYYLDGVGDESDVPMAELKTTVPVDITLDNFDPGRDAFDGLLLAGSDLGIDEADTTKYQQWNTTVGGIKLYGSASLSLWSAMKDFDVDKTGSISAYLVDSNATGSSLIEIASDTITRADWDADNTGSWIEDTFNFGTVDYTLAADRYLGVKIVVNNGLAADGMWLAYDVTTSPSKLTVTAINTAPTAIEPNSFSIDENINTTGGTSIGTLTASDPDSDETFIYTIQGGTDQSSFSIGGDNSDELILTDGVLDFENKPSYSVTVRVGDSDGNTYDEIISVTVNDLTDILVVNTVDDYASGDVRYGDTSSIRALLADKGSDNLISLREAIEATNADPNGSTPDEIHFDITGTITVVSNGLPVISDSVIIDGTTDPDYVDAPVIELIGASAGASTNGLTLTGDEVTIKGLAINQFDGHGISISSNNNTIQGNYIGTDVDGTVSPALGNNGDGILISDSSGNTIGGADAAQRNVIVQNDGAAGIVITGGGSTDNEVFGNYIGIGPDGNTAMGNAEEGIRILNGASDNVIGGANAGEGNVISANGDEGLVIDGSGSDGNLVRGNYIGLNADGDVGLGNFGNGILISDGASSNIIGGNGVGDTNVISASIGNGIVIEDAGTSNNIVLGNFIGTGADGLSSIGNGDKGILIMNNATNNTIGGTGDDDGNLIAYNTQAGVRILNNGTVGNAVLGNIIHSNGQLGIDIYDSNFGAAEDNDSKDMDNGPNNVQNYPVLSEAVVNSAGDQVTISGTLDSEPGKTFRIEFFTNSNSESYGEAETYLDSIDVTTHSTTGIADITAVLTATLAAGDYVTATATELETGTPRSTSEFSLNQIVTFTPLAVADNFTVNEGSTTNLDLATNDSDADDGLNLDSITIVSGPSNGTIDSINADGTVDYTHDGSETISDSFTYTIEDLATATSNTVTVSLTITTVNDEPTLTVSASDPTFIVGEGATGLFSGTSVDTVEGGQTIEALTLRVTNVMDGGNEILNIDGNQIALADGTSGTTSTNGLLFNVNVTGSTATVTLTGGMLSTADTEVLVNSLSYQHNSGNPNTGDRTVTLTSLVDSGGTSNGGDNTATLSVASTVTVQENSNTSDLWLSTADSASDNNGTVGDEQDIVSLDNPNLGLELGDGDSGTTNGTFATEYTLPENVRALHYVNTAVTVDTFIDDATGTYELQPGQIVVSMRADDKNDFDVPTIGDVNITVNNTDVLVYTPGTGKYEFLLEDAIFKADGTTPANIHAISIVEQDTTIGVDTELSAGTYLIARSDPDVHADISTYDNTNGRQDLLLGVDFLSDASKQIQGLELLEADLEVGGITLTEGTLLITVQSDISQTVGSGAITADVDEIDVIALTINATEQDSVTPNTDVDAQILFDGSDVNLDISGKEINGLTLVGNNLGPVNEAPTTSLVTLTAIAEDSSARTITQAELLTHANDLDGDSMTATGLSISSGLGSLVDNGDGTWDYTPAGDDDTSIDFSYSITDGTDSVAGTATLDITPVNDAPTTSLVTLTSIGEDSGARTITQAELLSNAGDTEGDSLTATGLTISAGAGSLADNGDGTWDYTPTSNDYTGVSFSYTITDGTDSVAGTATLDITPVNDAPVIVNNNPLNVPEEATRTITSAILSASDVDNSAAEIVYELTSTPNGGHVRLNGSSLGVGDSFTQADINSGLVTYRDSDEGTTTSFTFTLGDGTYTSGDISFSINGSPINDAPVVIAPGSALTATEQTGLNIHASGFSVTDSDEADLGGLATLSVGEGILTVTEGDSGISIDSGNASNSVILSGTIAQINSLLNGTSSGTIIYFNDSDNPSASTVLTVTVNDEGNSGSDPGISGDSSSEEGSNSVVINITAINDAPTLDINSLILNQGETITLSNSMLLATDIENVAVDLTFTVSNISNGFFAFTTDTTTAITSFTQDDINNSRVVFHHDNGELAPTYDVSVSDGTVSTAASPATVTFTGTADGILWVTMDGDEGTSSEVPGVETIDLEDGDILQQANPGFALGQAATDGTFSVAFDASNFSTDANINGIHYVTSEVVIGSGINEITLQAGDLLLTTANDKSFFSNGAVPEAELDVLKEDIFYFRPDELGDYSVGNFYSLLEDPVQDNTTIRGITLIEKSVLVGDSWLSQGDILFSRSGGADNNDIWLLETDTLDPQDGGTYPLAQKLIEGDDVGVDIDEKIYGLDVLEEDTIIGGQNYSSGTILIALDADDTDGLGGTAQVVNREDIAALTVTQTTLESGSAQVDASLMFDGDDVSGSDVNFDTNNEAIDGFTLTVDVSDANIAPTGTTLVVAADEETLTPIDISSNVSDVDGTVDLTTATVTGGTSNGTLVNNGDGTFSYTGDSDFVGTDSFTYTVEDNDGQTSSDITVTINVSDVNDAPTGTTLVVAADEETLTAIDISGNVSDVDGTVDLTTTTVTGGTSNGTLVNNGDGTFSYTGDTDFIGTDSFTYTVEDNDGQVSANITVTINVSDINDAPTGTTLVVAADEETLTPIDISGNVSDVDGTVDLTTTTVTGGTTNGTLINNGDGTFSYTGNTDFVGTDSFTYTVEDNDGQVSSNITVTINVSDINDAPTGTTLVVAADEETLTPIDISGNVSDVDGTVDLTTATVTGGTSNGTLINNGDGTFSYTGDTDFVGTDSFTYTVEDNDGQISSDITVTINVSDVNDAPTGTTLVVAADEETLTAIDISGNIADVDGTVDLTTTTVTGGTSNGTLINNGDGTFSYTGDTDFVGTDSFTYTVEDNDGQTSSDITVTINVSDINDAPTGTTLVVAADEETLTPIDISSNVSDVDGTVDLTTTTVTAGTSNGTLINNGDGTFSYTGNTDFVGTDSFTYIVEDNDGQVSANITVTINVSDINDAPTGTTLVAAADEETLTPIDISGNVSDVDGMVDLTTTTVTAGTSNGTLINNGDGTFSYTGNTDFVGTDSFTYTVEDNDGQVSANITVTINVSDINDAPTGTTLVVAADEETLTPIDISSNVSDVDGTVDLTTAMVTGGTSNGTLINNGDGTFSYTGDTDFVGTDSFTYTVEDNDGQTSSDITVTINVSDVNDAPTGTTLVVAADEETLTAIDISGNVSDVDGTVDLTTTTVTGGTSNGTLVNNGDGTFSYTGNTDFVGTDSFTYTVEDNDGQTSSDITVTINVSDINDAPTSSPVTLTAIAEDSGARTITLAELLTNASDIEGNFMTVTGLTISAGLGSLVDNGDGTWNYTPAGNDDTSIDFSYTITDGTDSVAGSATLDITPVNDSPAASGTYTVTGTDINTTSTAVQVSDILGDASITSSDVDGDTLGIAVFAKSGNGTWEYSTNGASGWTDFGTLNPNAALLLSETTWLRYVPDGLNGEIVNFDFRAWDMSTDFASDNGLPRFGDTVPGGSDSAYSNGSANVSLTVNAVNSAPTTSAVTLTAIAEDSGARTITQAELLVNANDLEGDSLTATDLAISAGNGSLVDNGDGTWDYAPASDDDTSVSFSYTITDGTAPVAGTASLDITLVNDAPVAADNTINITEDTALTGTLPSATDVENDVVTYSIDTPASNGIAVVNSDGSFSYSPSAGWSGVDSFTYIVTDSGGAEGTATVTVTVQPVAAPPAEPADATDSEGSTAPSEEPQETATEEQTVVDEEYIEPVSFETTQENSLEPASVTIQTNEDTADKETDDEPNTSTSYNVVEEPQQLPATQPIADPVDQVSTSQESRALPRVARESAGHDNTAHKKSFTTQLLQRYLERLQFNDEVEYNQALTHLSNALDDFKKEASDDVTYYKTVIGSAIAVSTGLSVGYVVWLIRGGMLLSSVLFSMPAWQIADPLPLLAHSNDEEDEEDGETLETIIKSGSATAKEMANKDKKGVNLEH